MLDKANKNHCNWSRYLVSVHSVDDTEYDWLLYRSIKGKLSLFVSSKNGEYGVDDFYYLHVRGLTNDHLKYITM